MCLGVPGRVVSVSGDVADVDFWGVRRQVRLELVNEPVGPGDYILNHVGFAIRRIPAGDIAATENSTASLMPEGLLQAFGENDVRDLIAYLMQK